MWNMNKIKNIIVLLALMPLCAWANEDKLQQAATLYAQRSYEEAATIYAELLNQGESADLYYNYANACFKLGRTAEAILNYERALKLNPRHADARFNLEYANTQITDKIDPVPTFFFRKWLRDLGSQLSSDQWAVLSVSLFGATLVLALLFIFGRFVALRKTAFFMGIVALLLSLISMAYAFSRKRYMQEHTEAIVMAGSVTVASAPDRSGTELFVLHDGTKVILTDSVGEWREIRISDGQTGWVPRTAIEPI